MDELIQCLNTAENSNVKLFFLTRRKNPQTKVITYHVMNSRIRAAVAKDLKVNGYNQIHRIQSHDHEIFDYGTLSHSDRTIVETIDYRCVPFLENILQVIAQPNSDTPISDDDYPNVWGYIVRVENNNKTAFLFRKYTPKKLLEKGKLSCVIDSQGHFAKLTGQAIALDAYYDAALLLKATTPGTPDELQKMYIFSRGSFESLFSFVEEYRRQVEGNQEYLSGKGILENVSQIVTTCCADTRALRKLARILTSRSCDSLTTTKIAATINDYGLSVTLNKEGKILVSAEHIWDILRILNDDYVESKATGNKYESRSKVRK